MNTVRGKREENRILNFILFQVTCLMLCLSAQAQEPDTTSRKPVIVEIEKKDGAVLRGTLLGVVRDSVTFVDMSGNQSRIAMREIQNIDYRPDQKKIDRWFQSPNTVRYFLAGTAQTLAKKEVVISSAYAFLHAGHFGITDRLTVSAGGDLFGGSTLFTGIKGNIFRKPKYKFSVIGNYFFLPDGFLETNSGEVFRHLGMISGVGTWGNANSHLTFGAGYMYFAKGFLPPLISASGTLRFSKHFAAVTENWYFLIDSRDVELPALISLGLRYISKRHCVDLGFYSDHKSFFDTTLPYVSYMFNVNGHRVR